MRKSARRIDLVVRYGASPAEDCRLHSAVLLITSS